MGSLPVSKVLHNVAMKPYGGAVSHSHIVKVCTQDQCKETGNLHPDISTRLFYNSKVNRQNVESLLAKGQQVKSLKHSTEARGKRIRAGSVTRPKSVHNVSSEKYKKLPYYCFLHHHKSSSRGRQ